MGGSFSLAHLGRRGARSQTRLACGCGSHCGPAYSKGPHCHSVDQPEDRVADAPYVERHQPLRAAHVSPLERVDDREVLADERLDAPGRHDGHGPDGSDLLAHVLEDVDELRNLGSLEQVLVELLAKRAHRGGGGPGATRPEVRPLGEALHQYLLKRAENAKRSEEHTYELQSPV